MPRPRSSSKGVQGGEHTVADVQFVPATAERWSQLERLFGERGACAGCWCMLWRLSRREWEAGKGESNKRALARIVQGGSPPGILAIAGDVAIGWCALAPREDYPQLERSRVLKPVDSRPVWSVSCLFVDRAYRRMGLSVRLLDAAAELAASRGATILEGYPVEPKSGETPDAFAWTGIASAFRAAGFEEVERRSPTRPIMRRSLVASPGSRM